MRMHGNPKTDVSPPLRGVLARAFAGTVSSSVRAAFILFQCATSPPTTLRHAALLLLCALCALRAPALAHHARAALPAAKAGACATRGDDTLLRAHHRCAPAHAPSDPLRRSYVLRRVCLGYERKGTSTERVRMRRVRRTT